MKLSQFKFKLPEELIAQTPSEERDEARMMVLHKKTGEMEHKVFKDIIDYFDDGDLMLLNDTKVFPARLYGNKEKTNARIEVFLLRELNEEHKLWDVLVEPARKIRIGNKLYFGEDDSMVAEVIDNTTSRGRTLRFLYDGSHDEFKEALFKLGQTPLPLYINDFSRSRDEIVTRLNQSVKQKRCKIAFIDYLGLFQDALTIGNVKLYQVIAKITGTLKAAAKRLGIPVVLLCQMNRDAVREKRAPELYDLRDSGSIEQDADIVLMRDPKPDEGRILMWVRKNRNGKRDNALILVPNNSYTAFDEGNALHELRSPSESPVQTSLDFHYDPEEQ